MTNFDYLRQQLCTNGLLDISWNLHQQLLFLYYECGLSTKMISELSGNYISHTTSNRLLFRFKIKLRNRGGVNNPYGRKGKSRRR